MNKYALLILSAAILFFSSCAIGPLVSHETARTVGDSNHEIVAGGGQAGYVFKWNYGLSKNFDIGLHWESLSVGIRAKYAFLNQQSGGMSMALALGTGSSIGGSHNYGDVMLSYLTGAWEPYATARFVQVKNDPLKFQNENTGQVDFAVSAFEYQYGQYILGSRIWFNKHWLFSIEASKLYSISSGVTIGSEVIGGAALGYRF